MRAKESSRAWEKLLALFRVGRPGRRVFGLVQPRVLRASVSAEQLIPGHLLGSGH